jgi:hypothetical protein
MDEGGGGMYPGGGNVNVPANLPQPGTDYPAGDFDAHDPKWTGKTPTPNIDVWAHDDTVQAGRTYHYRISYKIQNPIYGGMNVAVNDQLPQQFAIQSKPSDWSSPVPIPNLVNFFVQSSKSPNAPTVRFDVFRWEKGEQKNEVFTVGPGDQVGGVKSNIDFSTGWTVVDFRYDDRQSDWQILMMNNKEGNIVVRSYKADHDDELYRGLQEQVKQQKLLANPTGVPGGPGGVPPPGPGATPGGRPPAIR